jgi:hypothetical protein
MIHFALYFEPTAEIPIWLDPYSEILESHIHYVSVCPIDSAQRRVLKRLANEWQDSRAKLSKRLISAYISHAALFGDYRQSRTMTLRIMTVKATAK